MYAICVKKLNESTWKQIKIQASVTQAVQCNEEKEYKNERLAVCTVHIK